MIGALHDEKKSSKLLVSGTLIVEPQLIKHATSASKCQSTLQLLYDRLAGPVSRKRSMEVQQVADDVLQYKLSMSDGQIYKGPPMGESLYYKKGYKEICICWGMQWILSLFNNSMVSSLVSLLFRYTVRIKVTFSLPGAPISYVMSCSPPDFDYSHQGGSLFFWGKKQVQEN